MIHDRIKNSSTYALGKHWEKAFEFIKAQSIDTEETRYELGEGMYALIDSYETKPKEKCLFEAHKKYVDIQFTIGGGETIYWHDASLLTIKKAYNEELDFCFYEIPKEESLALENRAGYFSVFWPSDAHMPQVSLKGEKRVKKGVIKVPIELLRG